MELFTRSQRITHVAFNPLNYVDFYPPLNSLPHAGGDARSFPRLRGKVGMGGASFAVQTLSKANNHPIARRVISGGVLSTLRVPSHPAKVTPTPPARSATAHSQGLKCQGRWKTRVART